MSDEYYQFPKWLLQTDLNDTERLVYILILDRARLSQRSGYNKGGNCYGIITAREMSDRLGRSMTQIRCAIRKLSSSGLVDIQHGKGICSWYFPKMPDGGFAVPYRETDREGSGKPSRPYRKTAHNAPSGKPHTSKNEMITNNPVGESTYVDPPNWAESKKEDAKPSPEALARLMAFGSE